MKKVGKSSSAGTNVESSKNAQDSQVSQPCAKPNVVGCAGIELMDDFVDFALKTFKKAHPLSSLKKLEEEMLEVAHEIQHGHENLAEEYADCMMCLLDSAARIGIKPKDLMVAFAAKLEVNKNRKWVKNPNNTYSHVA